MKLANPCVRSASCFKRCPSTVHDNRLQSCCKRVCRGWIWARHHQASAGANTRHSRHSFHFAHTASGILSARVGRRGPHHQDARVRHGGAQHDIFSIDSQTWNSCRRGLSCPSSSKSISHASPPTPFRQFPLFRSFSLLLCNVDAASAFDAHRPTS